MTVGHVTAAKLLGRVAGRADAQGHAPGDRLWLRVLRQLDERRYLVTFRDGQHVVSSTVGLTVGSTVRAVVTAVGEKLELRYVGEDEVATVMEDHAAAGEDAIAELAKRYVVELQAAERAAIEQAAQRVAEPEAMVAGGLFLGKLGLGVGAANLRALYSVQQWSMQPAESGPADESAGAGEHTAPIDVAEQMLAALQERELDGGSDEQDERERARRLLNEQDEGNVAYRFGVLPVLVADQLVELDIVHFRERRRDDEQARARRLVMTFSTSTLGRVEVVAQALGERLAVAITTDSATGRDVLAARAADVRGLVERLGWNVESVSYQVATRVERASRSVIDHVLDGDTLSAWV
jgi:hypothetical protein